MTWVILALVAVLLIAGGLLMWRKQRSQHLQQSFGPEYDRTVEAHGDQRAAESELADRRKRHDQLDIRPLDPATREEYSGRWRAAQTHFVDKPTAAVAEADVLVIEVMRDRGYPVEDFEQRATDVSVDHPDVVQNYRSAHSISTAAVEDRASTEDLRQAMVHFRALFTELLDDRDEPRRDEEKTHGTA